MSDTIQFPQQRGVSGSGNGGNLNDRLRQVEGDIREIKARIEKVATTDDIEIATGKVKVWALTGALVGTMAIIGWLVFFVVRSVG